MSRKKPRKGMKPPPDPSAAEESLDGRSAARALKAALADSTKAANEVGEAAAPTAPRRRRPPTSHGEVPPRPVAPELPVAKPPQQPGLSRPPFHRRHDLAVVVIALLVFGAGAVFARSLARSTPRRFDRLGLSFHRPGLFLPPQAAEPPSKEPAADGTPLPYHVIYRSPADPLVRLEVLVDQQPAYKNLRATRALDRVSQYGEMVWVRDSADVKIGGRLWLRSHYRYALRPSTFDAPTVATAIELASTNGALFYVVTLHGDPKAAAELAEAVMPTLTVDANHPAAAAPKE